MLDPMDSENVSKGLRKIAIELGEDESFVAKAKLQVLRDRLKQHPVFLPTTKLEQLCIQYQVKIIFSPKFHCELNPIEGLWAYMKYFVRKFTYQSFKKMRELILLSREQYSKRNINIKLVRRFWHCLIAYNFSGNNRGGEGFFLKLFLIYFLPQESAKFREATRYRAYNLRAYTRSINPH